MALLISGRKGCVITHVGDVRLGGVAEHLDDLLVAPDGRVVEGGLLEDVAGGHVGALGDEELDRRAAVPVGVGVRGAICHVSRYLGSVPVEAS